MFASTVMWLFLLQGRKKVTPTGPPLILVNKDQDRGQPCLRAWKAETLTHAFDKGQALQMEERNRWGT